MSSSHRTGSRAGDAGPEAKSSGRAASHQCPSSLTQGQVPSVLAGSHL